MTTERGRFAMVPLRVAADRRLGEWDLRVLIALLGTARWDEAKERMQPLRIRATTVVRILEAEMPSARALVQRSLRHLEELEYLTRRAPEGRAGTYDLGPTWWAGAVDILLKSVPGEGELVFGARTVECAVPRTVELTPLPESAHRRVRGLGGRGETAVQTKTFIDKTRRGDLTAGGVDNLPRQAGSARWATPVRRLSGPDGAKAPEGRTATTRGPAAASGDEVGSQTRHPLERVPSTLDSGAVVGAVGVTWGGFLTAIRARPDLGAGALRQAAERFAARARQERPAKPDRAWAGWIARERR